MKNTTQYSQNIKKLFNALKKGAEKSKKPVYQDIVEAIIFAVLCQNSPESAVKTALRKIQSHFVDNNDLRVARTEEIVEVIGSDITNAPKAAGALIAQLNAVFQKYDSLAPEDFSGVGKKNAKEILEKFNGMTPFVCNYVMLTALNAHTIPLTDKMIEYLKTNNLVDPHWDNAQIVSFIEKQISASDAYAFYAIIRHDSELANPKAVSIVSEGKKTAAKKKPKSEK
jgi:endonuclease III